MKIYNCKKPVNLDLLEGRKDLQMIDAKLLFGSEHLEFAMETAKRAFVNNENISTNIFVETIVRASGQRQIKKALEMYGLRDSKEVAVFTENKTIDLEGFLDAKETVITLDRGRLKSLKEAFQITEAEINAASSSVEEAVKNLIKERIALVSVL